MHIQSTKPSLSPRARLALLCLLVLIGATALATARAEANWLPERTLASGSYGSPVEAVTAADGTTTTVWINELDNDVYARRVSAAGVPIGEPMLVADVASPAYLDASIDATGKVTVAWRRDGEVVQSEVQARQIDADGNLLPTTHLIASLAGLIQDVGVASAPDGTAAVIWENTSNDGILVRRISDEGDVGPVIGFDFGPDSSGEPRIVAAPPGNPRAGEFVVNWIEFDAGGPRYIAYSQPLLANGTKGTRLALSDAEPGSAYSPQTLFMPDGSTVTTWERSQVGDTAIVSRRISAAGAAADPVDVTPPGANPNRYHSTTVDAAGTLTVGYNHYIGGETYSYHVRRLTADDQLSAVLNPFTTTSDIFFQEGFPLATTPSGASVVAAEVGSYGDAQDRHLQVRVVTPDNTLGELSIKSGGTWSPSLSSSPLDTINLYRYIGDEEQANAIVQQWNPAYFPKASVRFKGKPTAKPKKLKPGKAATIQVRLQNSGDAAAKGVKVCTKLSKKLKKAFKNKCAKVATLAPGKNGALKIKLKSKRAGVKPGKAYKVKLELTGKHATGGSIAKRKTTAKVRVG